MAKAAAAVIRDQSPPLMMLGIICALLFNAGLLAVSPFVRVGFFPSAFASTPNATLRRDLQ